MSMLNEAGFQADFSTVRYEEEGIDSSLIVYAKKYYL